ncbi:MAG: hypothetical protein AABX11_04480 [Nanoarchaeota archaeon]
MYFLPKRKKDEIPERRENTPPLVILTRETPPQRQYWINGEHQRYMSASEVKSLLQELGFSRNPEFLKAYRLLNHRDPLTEGNVYQINYYLERQKKSDS